MILIVPCEKMTPRLPVSRTSVIQPSIAGTRRRRSYYIYNGFISRPALVAATVHMYVNNVIHNLLQETAEIINMESIE